MATISYVVRDYRTDAVISVHSQKGLAESVKNRVQLGGYDNNPRRAYIVREMRYGYDVNQLYVK